MTDTAVPFRILPRLDDRNRGFWTSGADGVLRFLRCDDCGYWNHPPTPLCPRCHSKRQSYTATSGTATLHTFTVNHQAWMPDYQKSRAALKALYNKYRTTQGLDIDAELALAGVLGQIADVAVRGQHAVIVAQVALDGSRLGR